MPIHCNLPSGYNNLGCVDEIFSFLNGETRFNSQFFVTVVSLFKKTTTLPKLFEKPKLQPSAKFKFF